MQSALKPSWQNLKGAGFTNPVEEIVGQIVDWKLEANNFGGNNITFSLSQCQILHSDTPYPYPDWNLAIRFSDSQNSGWGMFGVSAAAALGIDIELLDIDLLKGRWVHILRSHHEFGEDRNAQPDPVTGVKPKIMGMVYRIVKCINQGEAVTSVKGMVFSAAANPAPVVASTPIVSTNVVTPTVIAAQPTAPAASPSSNVTPAQQALLLLHGKDTAGFFQVAVPDPICRQDPALVDSILTNSFIVAKIASGEVIKNADGTHSVVGMA